jgi:hypothetical protein
LKDVFFVASYNALANITDTYNTVWPIAVGLWNLRYQVKGIKAEFPTITEAQLAAKFSVGSGIHGVNYKNAFEENTWENQQSNFAWILLNSTIPIFEGWLESLRDTNFPTLNVKAMQFPQQAISEIRRLTTPESVVLKNSFYQIYSNKKWRSFAKLNNLLCCFRYFKEMRNCYMHNGRRADTKLVNAYNDFHPIATASDLDVSECPEHYVPVIDQLIKISLRGVVGLSFIVIKIISTVDSELLKSVQAEAEVISRFRKCPSFGRTLKPDVTKANKQVSRYITQCGYVKPLFPDDLRAFLLDHHLLYR